MPQIPYQRFPTVEPSGPPGVYETQRATPEAFGAQVGRGLQVVGGALDQAGEVARQVSKLYNASATDEANTRLDTMVRPIVGKFRTLEGADAMNARPEVLQQIEDIRQQVRSGLRNGEQQRMYDVMSRHDMRRYLDEVEFHSSREARVWQGKTAAGAIENELNKTADFWHDNAAFAESLAKIKIQADQLSQLKGIDPESEAGKLAVTHYQGEAWDSRLKSVATIDPHLARQLFDANADQIDAKHRAALDVYLANREALFDRAREVEAYRVEKQLEAARKEEVRQTQEAIVQRLGAGKLTAADVLNSNLPAVGEGSKEHFLNVLRTRATDLAEPIKTDPRVMLDLFARIHAADSDPRKLTDENELNQAYIAKKLSFTDLGHLRQEFVQLRSPEGNNLLADVNRVRQVARSMMLRSAVGAALPEVAEEGAYRFNIDLTRKVDEYRKAGKDPRLLITPGTPDYVLDPAKVSTYTTPMRIAVANKAAEMRAIEARRLNLPSGFEFSELTPEAVTQGMPPMAMNKTIGEVRQLVGGKWVEPVHVANNDEYKKLPPGTVFIAPDKTVRFKPTAAQPAAERPKPASAPASATTPSMPRLVPELEEPADKAERKRAYRETIETRNFDANVQIAERAILAFEEAGAYVTRGSPLAMASAAPISAAKAVLAGIPSDAEKAASDFRTIVKAGKFKPSHAQLISDALNSGALTESEAHTARAMLEKIVEQSQRTAP